MTTPQSPRFGALLKSLRIAAGLTQEALAERARLSTRGLQDLERGVHQTPRRDTAELLATALRLSAHSRAEFLAAAQGQPLSGSQEPAVPQPSAPAGTLGFSSSAPLPLVGREREVALLHDFLAGVHPAGVVGGATRVLLLAGEPGAGKTRLLQAAAQQAIATGWSVLASGCQRRGGQDPYTPLLDALAEYLRLQRPEYLGADLEGCAWLVRLLPELADVLEPLPVASLPPEQERRLIYAAVARYLTNVSGPGGTLLVLDDLQWAGPDALDLLMALARRAALPLRIVGAYRDTEVRPEDPLGVLLADLAHTRLGQQLPVGPLAPDEAATLLTDLLAGIAGGERLGAATVLQRADGMPFYLVSYAQALATGVLDAVPWDVAQGVRQRLALLPEAARQILGAAAVVGRHAKRALLMAVVGQTEEVVLTGLEAACRARLLLEEGDEEYAFAHDVIREVVEDDLGTARRAMLHRKVAAALEADRPPASAEVLAYHYGRGGQAGKAVSYREQAGDLAWAEFAHSTAESHYRAVLDHLERVGHSQEVGRLRQKLGQTLFRTGCYEEALPLLAHAAETYRAAGDLENLMRVTAWMGRAHALRGTVNAGIALITVLQEHLDRAEAAPPLAVLDEALGVLLFTAGRYREALAAGERAADLARASGDDATLVQVAWARANILQMLGQLTESKRAAQEVLALAGAVGDHECLVAIPRDLAYIHALCGDFELGSRYISRSFELAEQVGNQAALSFTLMIRGWLTDLSGDRSSAHADLEESLELSRQGEVSWYTPYPLIFQARLLLADGAWAEAGTLAEEARALTGQSGDLQARRWATAVLAEMEVLGGRPHAATTLLVPLLDRTGLEECDVTVFLPVLAWAYLEQGQVAQATDAIEQALTRARREQMRLVLVEALRVRTMIQVRRERWAAAARDVAEGLALTQAMPYPYGEARLLHVDAALHAQRGTPRAARERLEAACAIFQRLGARGEIARVEHDLDALLSRSSHAAAH